MRYAVDQVGEELGVDCERPQNTRIRALAFACGSRRLPIATMGWREVILEMWTLWLIAAVLYALMLRDIAQEVRGR